MYLMARDNHFSLSLEPLGLLFLTCIVVELEQHTMSTSATAVGSGACHCREKIQYVTPLCDNNFSLIVAALLHPGANPLRDLGRCAIPMA